MKRLRRLWGYASDSIIPIAVLLIVGLTLSWVVYDEYQQVQVSEYRLLEAHARNADAQVTSALDKVDHLLTLMVEERLKENSLPRNAFAALSEPYRKDLPELGTLLVADAGGRILLGTDQTIIGRDVSQEAYFAAHLDRGRSPKIFMSRPDKRLLGVNAVVFTLPIVDANQQFLGIVGVTIGFSFFPKVLKSVHSDDSASMAVIFNREGDLLLRIGDPEKFFGKNIANVSQVFQDHANAGTQVTRHIGPSLQDGKTRLFLVRTVGDTGIGLILSRQFDEVLATWRRNVFVYVLIFVFTTVVVTFLALVAERRKRQVLAGKVFSEQLIATANVMVVGLDAIGCITVFNETAERISGYRRDEVLGHSWFELVLPTTDFSSVTDMLYADGDASDLLHATEYSILTKAGLERTIAWKNSVIQVPRSVICFGIDVTERKQMEIALFTAMQQANDSSVAKTKFIAAASHDLRQPIHAQGLFLEVLSRTELSAQQRELLASASAASDASAEMLNTLLDFSRVEAGVIEPQLQAFGMQPLLNKIEREFVSQADANGLAYRSRETALVVQSDPALIELILRNLVSNAIRYTERGGVLVTCRRRGQQAVLEVWDTGIGIEPSQQSEVFREFHQLGNPERDRRKGLGLGLAIVSGLARMLGHDLALVSTLQRGSVFRLTLPLATAASAVAPLMVESGKVRTLQMRVLLIDDDEAVREGMLHLLKDWGCECAVAETIEEALALARIEAPDVIISDYRLREQRTGIEAIATLRHLLGDALPALLITGDTAPERLREARASGIPLLHKPVSPSQLYRGLNSLLS